MVQSYISNDMHYFVLLLEITTIQMLLFFTVLNSEYETKEKCHYFKTSNISCDFFLQFNLKFLGFFHNEKQ